MPSHSLQRLRAPDRCFRWAGSLLCLFCLTRCGQSDYHIFLQHVNCIYDVYHTQLQHVNCIYDDYHTQLQRINCAQ